MQTYLKTRQPKQPLGWVKSDWFFNFLNFIYLFFFKQVWVFFSTAGLLCRVFSTDLHGVTLMPILFELQLSLWDSAVDVALPLINY